MTPTTGDIRNSDEVRAGLKRDTIVLVVHYGVLDRDKSRRANVKPIGVLWSDGCGGNSLHREPAEHDIRSASRDRLEDVGRVPDENVLDGDA